MGSKGKAAVVTGEDEEDEETEDEEDEESEDEEEGEEDTPAYVASSSVPAVPPLSASPASAARVSVAPAAPAVPGASSASPSSTTPVASSASIPPTLYLDRTAYNVLKDKRRNTFEGKYSIPLRDRSGHVPLMIPGTGPWMFGDKEILPCARALWFHVDREDFPRFCQTLETARGLASGGSPKNHRDAEALWIKEHFAIVSRTHVSQAHLTNVCNSLSFPWNPTTVTFANI